MYHIRRMKKGKVLLSSLQRIWSFFTTSYSRYRTHIIGFVNILAQIGAMIAAIVALFALKEAILQRESMYRPELRVGESIICADVSDFDHVKYYKIKNKSLDMTSESDAAWFLVNNIGMGSALSVRIRMHIDREMMAQWLSVSNTYEEDDFDEENVFDTLYVGKEMLLLPKGDLTRTWREDYIMPVTNTQESCNVYFSEMGFKSLLKLFLWLKESGRFDNSYDFLIPTELKYKDINGKDYIKEYDTLFRLAFAKGDMTKIVCLIKSGQPYREDYEDFKEEMNEQDIIRVYKSY